MLNKKKTLSMALVMGIGVIGFVPATTSAMTRQQAVQFQNELNREIVSRYNDGLNAYKLGDYRGCIQQLTINQVAARYQRGKDYNIALGDSYYKLKQYAQATPYLKRAYNTGASELPIVNLDLGMSFYAMGNYAPSIQFLQKAVNSNMTNGDTWWALVDAYRQTGNKNGMEKTAASMIEKFPNYNKDMYLIVANGLEERQQYQSVSVAGLRGLKYFPNDGDLLYWAGHGYYMSGMYAEAIPYLDKSNAVMPNNIDTLYDLGASYLQLDKLDEASACADLMVRIDKNNAKTQDLYKAVQEKIMQKQMQQQMEQDMINQNIQAAQQAADEGVAQANMTMAMPAGMM